MGKHSQSPKKKKSKPILIRIFPTRTIKHQVLGSPLIGRDLLMGFDILHQIPNLRWSLKGLSHIHLPLKKNEDVNPTKANHWGMNPKRLALVKQEISTLLSEGLIKPTSSPWACEAFYVNKHAKQVWGKLRLVINYQDLNHFLANAKFPLPNKSALFQHLSNAKVFLKFDLKVRF